MKTGTGIALAGLLAMFLGFFPAPNDAVGRTTEVKGSAVVGGGAIRAARFSADLVWLASDAAAYISGTSLRVDGAYSTGTNALPVSRPDKP